MVRAGADSDPVQFRKRLKVQKRPGGIDRRLRQVAFVDGEDLLRAYFVVSQLPSRTTAIYQL